jgi:hypothetical protein
MNNQKLIKEIIKERNPEALFLEEMFDKALLGTVTLCGNKIIATYDSDKCIKILMKKFKLGELEAFEQFENTINNSPPSENKPVFLSDLRKVKDPSDYEKYKIF